MRRSFSLIVLSLSAVLTLGATACSSSSGGEPPAGAAGATGAMNGTYSTPISAAMGGTVKAGDASVVIPGGALAGDTTVTVVVTDKTGQPDEADIAAKIFTFGPDGTKFSAPVTMTLPFDGTAAPMGKTAQIVFLQDGKWVPLADSKVSGTTVIATTTHFTPFTVMWVSGQGQTGGGCDALAFTPCGGDLAGTWTFTAACATIGPGNDPFKGMCPSATIGVTVDFTGTITFNADMSYALNDMTSISEIITAPKSCTNGTCGTSDSKMTVMDLGDSCSSTSVPDMKTNAETGTWSVSGTQFTTIKMGSTSGDTLDYCVTGTTALVKQVDSKGNTFIYKVTK